MNQVLGDLLETDAPLAVFFDDIVIGGSSFKAHIHLVQEVLTKHGLVIKSKNPCIDKKEVKCLGSRISQQGLKPDPREIGYNNFLGQRRLNSSEDSWDCYLV